MHIFFYWVKSFPVEKNEFSSLNTNCEKFQNVLYNIDKNGKLKTSMKSEEITLKKVTMPQTSFTNKLVKQTPQIIDDVEMICA